MHTQCRCTYTAAIQKIQRCAGAGGFRGPKRLENTGVEQSETDLFLAGLPRAFAMLTCFVNLPEACRLCRFLHHVDQGPHVFWDGIQQKGQWKGSSPGRLLEEGGAAPGLVGAEPTGGRGAHWPSPSRWLGPRSRADQEGSLVLVR